MTRRERLLTVVVVLMLIVGAILSLVAFLPHRRVEAASGPRLVTFGAIVSDRDGSGHPTLQTDPRHRSFGVRRTGCEDGNMVIVPIVRSRFAPVVSVTVDGWLGDRGYEGHKRSSQGRRILVSFTRVTADGIERVSCSEVFSHPEADVSILGTVRL